MSVLATHFSPVPTALLRDPAISPPAKALYAVIRSYAHFGQEQGAYPSQVTLAAALGTTDRTIRRWRAELAAAGWLQWTFTSASDGALERTDYVCLDTPAGGVQTLVSTPPPESVAEEEGGVGSLVSGGADDDGGGWTPVSRGVGSPVSTPPWTPVSYNRETNYYREPLDREETGAQLGASPTASTPEQTPTPGPGETELRARLPAAAQDALTGYCRAAPYPAALVATILAEGPDTGTNAAAGKTWEIIGQALVEMQAAGTPFTALIFRSFVGKLLQRPAQNDGLTDADRFRQLAAQLRQAEKPAP